MTTSGWHQDHARFMNSYDGANGGYEKRKSMIQGSKVVELLGYIHSPIFNVDRCIPNGVDINIKLFPSKSNFQFMGETEVQLKIIDINVYIKKIKVAPSILLSHAKTLEISPAKYPITRVEVSKQKNLF